MAVYFYIIALCIRSVYNRQLEQLKFPVVFASGNSFTLFYAGSLC